VSPEELQARQRQYNLTRKAKAGRADRVANAIPKKCPKCGSAPYVKCVMPNGTFRGWTQMHNARLGL
jgi:hypothetical protein